MKVCKKCTISKEEQDFYKGRHECKKCTYARTRKWNAENPERHKANQAKSRDRNKEKINERQKEWLKNNPEKRKEVTRKYRESNRELCRKRSLECYYKNKEKYRDWREKNNDKVREYRKKWVERNKEFAVECNRQRKREYRKKHPEKIRAQKKLNYHVTKGNIKRPEKCQVCDETCKPEAHHSDYSKALEVIWVCNRCHNTIHIEQRRQLRRKEKQNA